MIEHSVWNAMLLSSQLQDSARGNEVWPAHIFPYV